MAAAILCWRWSCRAEAALEAGEECREAGCTLAERCLAGGGNQSSPAQGAQHTSADAEEDAVLCLAPCLWFSSCPVVFLFLSEMGKDPLVFSEKIKSVIYTHSLRFIKMNQQINLDFCSFVLCIQMTYPIRF